MGVIETQILWCTDVHLDHVQTAWAARDFGHRLRTSHPESSGLLVTGDIAEADSVTRILTELCEGYAGPLYFVLGNHDYYGSSFVAVDERMGEFSQGRPEIHWLTRSEVLLAPGVVLLGNDGFYDARFGDSRSDLRLRDFTEIEDLFVAQDDGFLPFLEVLRNRADQCARDLETCARRALRAHKPQTVLVATHVPPLREASFHQGKPADEKWAPYFSSRAMGDALLRLAEEFSSVQWIVFCGHTHGEGVVEARKNLTIYTGYAQYGAPDLAGLVTVREKAARVDLFRPKRAAG